MSTTGLFGFLIALVIAAIVIFPLGGALRKHPGPFYAVAILLTVAYTWALFTGVNLSGIRPLTAILQRGYLASIFLFVVMFTGCFDEGTAIRKKLQPIRGELSIMSFIFILGHLLTYLPSYLPRLGTLLTSRTNIALSLFVAILLTVVFCVLSVMSLRVIRNNMNKKVWKGIQRASYVMVALLLLHVGLVLAKSAFAGGFSLATISFSVYTLVCVVYAVLRIRKAMRDKARRAEHKAASEAAAA